MFVQPANPALKVRKPDGGHLDAAGEDVPDTTYWRRRLAAGDVVAASASSRPKKKDA